MVQEEELARITSEAEKERQDANREQLESERSALRALLERSASELTSGGRTHTIFTHWSLTQERGT